MHYLGLCLIGPDNVSVEGGLGQVMLTSKRPYLVRAIYEWIADNDLTPYLLVDASMDGVSVPSHAVQNDRVVLNVSVKAVDALQLGNQMISFDARFNGRVENIAVPLTAVLAIYARENGVGMAFDAEEDDGVNVDSEQPVLSAADEPKMNEKPTDSSKSKASAKAGAGKSGLRLVK